MHPNRAKIVELDADEDVTLKEVDTKKDAEVQGRVLESQAQVCHLDLEHAQKVLSMQEIDEAEPTKVEEVLEVVTATKLMTEVVTTATTFITAAPICKAQIEQDKAFVRELEAELNANINWNENFDREDLEMLWKIVQERFASSDPKNFSDDFFLNSLKAMFEKPNVESRIWRNQRGVHIITFTTT
nr:hypothetical protein [Tanacetum cinerariifolium]